MGDNTAVGKRDYNIVVGNTAVGKRDDNTVVGKWATTLWLEKGTATLWLATLQLEKGTTTQGLEKGRQHCGWKKGQHWGRKKLLQHCGWKKGNNFETVNKKGYHQLWGWDKKRWTYNSEVGYWEKLQQLWGWRRDNNTEAAKGRQHWGWKKETYNSEVGKEKHTTLRSDMKWIDDNSKVGNKRNRQ